MRTALITGVTGQDGSYMADLLLCKGYRVIGLVRNRSSLDAPNLIGLRARIEFDYVNTLNQDSITRLIAKYNPLEIYNFAAYSTGSGMFDDPLSIADLNGLFVCRILESIRLLGREIRFCQASSREIFGDPNETPQTELTPRKPRSPYGAAKLYADNMINIYRQHYGIFACSAILFNHESPRRGLAFVTRKITYQAAKIKLGLAKELVIGNLDSKRDWGFAGDYVKGMWLMLQNEKPSDYVLATGEQHSVRDFCDLAFSRLGFNYQDYVREDNSVFRAEEKIPLIGLATKACNELDWKPEVSFDNLVEMMVDSDLERLKQLITNKGFKSEI